MSEYEDIPDEVLAFALAELEAYERFAPASATAPTAASSVTPLPQASFRTPTPPLPVTPPKDVLHGTAALNYALFSAQASSSTQEPRVEPIKAETPEPVDTSSDFPNSDLESRYQDLRTLARGQGNLMAARFQASKEAFTANDKALAKVLSIEGRQHRTEMERLNREASKMVYVSHNAHRAPDEIDLHGQYATEAVEWTEKVIQSISGRYDSLHIIVGRGLHSTTSESKVANAVEEHLQRKGLWYRFDPYNVGVIVVRLH